MASKEFSGLDYYGMLNVSKEASTDDIRAAYKKNVLTYHPDRHIDITDKGQAQERFALITEAYETLTDPAKRALYDRYGHEGLQSGWELVTRFKDPDELLRAFDVYKFRKAELARQQRVNARSVFTMNMSAEDMWEIARGRRTLTELSGLAFAQSVDAPITERDTLTLGGMVDALNGNGTGALTFGWRRNVSLDTALSTEFTASRAYNKLRLVVDRRLSKYTVGHAAYVYGPQSSFIFSLTRQLGQYSSGVLGLTVGPTPGLRLALRREKDNNPLAAEVNILQQDMELALSKTKSLSKHSTLRVAGKIGIHGNYGVEAGITRRISKNSHAGFGVEISTQGVFFNFSFHRGGQKYLLPLLVSEEVNPKTVLFAIAVPTVVLSLTKMLVINPIKDRKNRKKSEERLRRNAATIVETRALAEADIRLMSATVMRKRAVEEQRGGLVIIEARYGNLAESVDVECPPWIDATIPLQYLVEDSQLILHPGPKSALLGLYDPRIGEEKDLLVRYLFKRKLHQVIVHDTDALAIPLQSHLLPEYKP